MGGMKPAKTSDFSAFMRRTMSLYVPLRKTTRSLKRGLTRTLQRLGWPSFSKTPTDRGPGAEALVGSRGKCAGETGKRRGRESLTMNGKANPIGPESCVSRREAWGEALTGVRAGQVLSHVTELVRDADSVCPAEGNTAARVIASAPPVPRGLRPWHVSETFCPGAGRSHGWPSEKGRSASGRLESRSRRRTAIRSQTLPWSL